MTDTAALLGVSHAIVAGFAAYVCVTYLWIITRHPREAGYARGWHIVLAAAALTTTQVRAYLTYRDHPEVWRIPVDLAIDAAWIVALVLIYGTTQQRRHRAARGKRRRDDTVEGG